MYFYIFMCPALSLVRHLGEVQFSENGVVLYITAWEKRAGKKIIELETIGRCIYLAERKTKRHLIKTKAQSGYWVNTTICQGGQKV